MDFRGSLLRRYMPSTAYRICRVEIINRQNTRIRFMISPGFCLYLNLNARHDLLKRFLKKKGNI
jgi:hypothetical protein